MRLGKVDVGVAALHGGCVEAIEAGVCLASFLNLPLQNRVVAAHLPHCRLVVTLARFTVLRPQRLFPSVDFREIVVHDACLLDCVPFG